MRIPTKAKHKAFVRMKGICKALRRKERQLKNRPKALWFRRDLFDPHLIWLRNGTPLRKPLPDVPLYISQQGIVYTLTRFGLRPLKTNLWKKNHYCWRTRNGNRQGQVYPYIKFRNVTFRIHELMALAWLHPKADDEDIDHINGDIEFCDLINLRVIKRSENHRCGGILKRLRNAARKYQLPYMAPARRTPEDMLELFERFKNRPINEAMSEEIERQKVLQALRSSGLHPERMSKERREEILRKYRVVDPDKIMEYEMTHHMEC